jgi:hypothetical protein
MTRTTSAANASLGDAKTEDAAEEKAEDEAEAKAEDSTEANAEGAGEANTEDAAEDAAEAKAEDAAVTVVEVVTVLIPAPGAEVYNVAEAVVEAKTEVTAQSTHRPLETDLQVHPPSPMLIAHKRSWHCIPYLIHRSQPGVGTWNAHSNQLQISHGLHGTSQRINQHSPPLAPCPRVDPPPRTRHKIPFPFLKLHHPLHHSLETDLTAHPQYGHGVVWSATSLQVRGGIRGTHANADAKIGRFLMGNETCV